MKSDKSFVMTVAYIMPLLTLACAAGIFFSAKYHKQFTDLEVLPILFFMLSCMSCLIALVAVALYDITDKKHAAVSKDFEQLKFKESVLSAKSRDDEFMKESLSAIREIANKINNDIDMDSINSEVLKQLAGLLGSKDGQEITMYLLDELNGELQPKAHLLGNTVYLGEALKKTSIDRTGVAEAFESCKTTFAACGKDEIVIIFPLSVAGRIAGVLRIKTYHEGTSSEKGDWLKLIETHLRSFTSVFSLAIRTPDFYMKAVIDGLTGLYTKRHFYNQLSYWVSAAKRSQEPFCLIMLDIDHFKKINDTYGHLTGDIVLKGVGDIVLKSLRSTSQAFRYGGEEIAIILPSTTIAEAEVAAERLRKKMEKTSFESESGKALKITISLGLAEWTESMADEKSLVASADKALYKAKETGRNKYCIST